MSNPSPTIEQVYAALFARLQTSTAWLTTGRRLQHYSDVPAEAQPAMFLAAGNLDPMIGAGRTPGMPYRWHLYPKIWIYANAGNDDTLIPSSLINPLISAVLSTLAPVTPGDRQTLGGLVYHCSLRGNIQTDEGLLGPQAVAIIPVDVLTGGDLS